MSKITYDYTENYIKSLITEDSDVLKEMEEFAVKN